MEPYVDEINQFFWSLTIFILFTCAFIYLSHYFKKEEIKNIQKLKIYKKIERLSYSLNFYIQRIRKILKHYEFKLKINLDIK